MQPVVIICLLLTINPLKAANNKIDSHNNLLLGASASQKLDIYMLLAKATLKNNTSQLVKRKNGSTM